MNNNCKLLIPFVDVKAPVSYQCKCGEIVDTTFDTFKRSKHKKCRKCIGIENNHNSTINIEIAKKFYEENDCELLEDTYINSKTKMKYKCSCGEIDYKTWNHFRSGQRCKKCATNKNIEQQRTDIEFIRKFLSDNGMELLQDSYQNVHTLLKHKCSCGEVAEKTWASLQSTPKCTCNYNYSSPLQRSYTKEDLIEYFWKYYTEFNKYPTSKEINDNPSYPSSSSYSRLFGNYKNFLVEIGVSSKDGWYKEDEKVIVKMYETENKEDIIECLIVKRSWSNIIKKAKSLGLERNKKLSNEELIKIIHDYYIKYNKNPTRKIFDKTDEFPNSRLYNTRFGSWNNALVLAGLKVKENTIFSSQEIQDILNRYKNGDQVKEIANDYNVNVNKIFGELRKHEIPTRTNQWNKDQVSILREHYPMTDWEILLEILSPFRKEDIVNKAYRLGIKRECYGYSEEELDVLKSNYGKVSTDELRKMLPNKTYASINNKAHKLGLVAREKWTEDEIEKLKIMYPHYSNKDLLTYFPNRSITSISSMATMILGITKDENYMDKYKDETKKELISYLKAFSEELGRTPYADEVMDNPNIPSSSTYHRYFGSYTNACIEAGLEPNQMMFGKAYSFISDNGDRCLSSKELEITNILIKNNIVYEKEILYRDIIGINDIPLIKCDWLLENGVVVEYFGMPEKDYYKERMDFKIELCDEYEVSLISLLPNDLTHNYSGLIRKFDEFGVKLVI